MIAEIDRGEARETRVTVDLDVSLGIVGIAPCIECEGTGDWTQYHPEPHLGPFQCVECKGTGRILVGL